MKVKGIQKVEVEINNKDLADLILQFIKSEYVDEGYDSTSDWVTKDGHTYIGSKEYHIASDTEVSTLVDAMNIIRYGYKLELDED